MAASYLDRRLIDAVHLGDASRVEPLLSLGADPGFVSGMHCALSLAASEDQPEIVRLLVSRGAEVDARVKGATALHWAAESGPSACEALLELGADPAVAAPTTGSMPAHLAARAGNARALRGLAAAGAPLDALDARGLAPLHIAATRSAEAVEALLSAGADPSVRSADGRTPLHMAEAGPAASLLRAGADPRAVDARGLEPAETCPPASRPAIAARAAELEAGRSALPARQSTPARGRSS